MSEAGGFLASFLSPARQTCGNAQAPRRSVFLEGATRQIRYTLPSTPQRDRLKPLTDNTGADGHTPKAQRDSRCISYTKPLYRGMIFDSTRPHNNSSLYFGTALSLPTTKRHRLAELSHKQFAHESPFATKFTIIERFVSKTGLWSCRTSPY